MDNESIFSRARELRELSKLVEYECEVCGRKPIASAGAIQVCQHIWNALLKLPQRDAPSFGIDTLAGLQIELFDDGPRRWGPT